MMNIRLLRICCLLLTLCGLFAASAAPTLANDEPTIAMPKTYHYHADIALNLSGSAATGYGDGDFDLTRQAFHVTIVAEDAQRKIRLELILIDNRLYIYNEQRQRWEYSDIAPGQTPEGLPQNTVPALSLPKHPTAPYQRSGEETIAGATTNKWRAVGPYNVLLPIITARTFSGALIEETLSVEALIGAANNYLYRLAVEEAGTITELGERAAPPSQVASKLAYTYSNFDQPVTITAPEGAVPASRSASGGLIGGDFTAPVARVTQLADTSDAERIIQILLPAGIPQP